MQSGPLPELINYQADKPPTVTLLNEVACDRTNWLKYNSGKKNYGQTTNKELFRQKELFYPLNRLIFVPACTWSEYILMG